MQEVHIDFLATISVERLMVFYFGLKYPIVRLT